MRPIRLHDARHSCGTALHLRGVPLAVIAKWLGHADASITARIYAHSQDEALKAASAMLGQVVTPSQAPRPPDDSGSVAGTLEDVGVGVGLDRMDLDGVAWANPPLWCAVEEFDLKVGTFIAEVVGNVRHPAGRGFWATRRRNPRAARYQRCKNCRVDGLASLKRIHWRRSTG